MVNKPGISWGLEAHVNLVKTTIGWLAVYYDNEHSKPEVITIFNPKNIYEETIVMRKMTLYNYNTCALCPQVRAELEWQD